MPGRSATSCASSSGAACCARVLARRSRRSPRCRSRGVAFDSREVEPGRSSWPCPAPRSTATTSPRPRSGAAPWRSLPSARSPRLGVPQLLVGSSRSSLALAAAWINGFPSHSARRRRRHRHGRQDDDLVPGPRDARRVRPARRPDQHDRGRSSAARAAATPGRRRPRRRRSSPTCARWSTPATNSRSSSRPRTAWPSNALPRSPTTSAVLTNITHEHLDLHGTYRGLRRRQALALRPTRRRRRPTRTRAGQSRR